MKVSDGISLKAQSILGESLLNPQQLQTIDIIPLKQIGQLKDCNKINNAKYKIYTFLPLVLYYQFQHFFNFYFLILTITQFIPALKVGFLINYVGPLSLVILFSILKEAHDDIKRHQRDRQINNQIYQVVTQDEIINIKAGQLDVGMIVQVDQNQTIPADLLILKTNTKEGHVFIRTDQLDGETDWKLRKPVQITDQQEINNLQGFAVVEQPSSNIYQFRGIYDCEQPESLSLENVVWASTVLATGSIFGLVIYTGRQTRMQLNQKQPNTKLGIFDKEIDKLSKQLFLIMVILSFIITFFSSPPLDFIYIIQYFTRYLILVSSIIPISMRVNLEFAKLKFSIQINKDKQIEGTITRNSNIPESLGRIQYLLSDKTGTLTQNDMIFKKLSMEMRTYTHEQIRSIKEILVEQNRINKYPLTSKTKDAKVRDLITCLSVCHNVTPIDQDDGQRLYQAQSPDEIALVKFTEQLGYIINNRTEDQISLTVSNNNTETYQILQCFPFSSETKRMGIIVQFGEKIIFYLKGADIIMRQFLPEQQQGFVDEECENLAREGLRTLVMCQRELSKQFYNEWLEKYEESQKIIINREKAVQKVIELLEDSMEFIGITGVEDKLQEDVAHTIENLRNAGIHVWMLTGDKMETAICIAILSGLKYPYQSFTTMKEVQDEIQMNMLLENFENNPNVVLVIDGTSLQTALKYFQKEFIMVAMKCPAVICCRCSPTQKSEITELLRQFSQKVVACIGDGGNDVGMIQSADVGIGIEGKEGKQAALASDFSILKFNALNLLLLWHGRLSYRRSALLSQFIVHRGLLISVVQAIFIFVFYFLSISLFSGILMLGYSTIFTMFPVFCIIYDEDVKQDIALKFPPLYKSLQQGRFLNTKTFLIWTWKALYQGFIIMLCSLLFFKQSFLKIETTVFTCLIFTQYAMTLTELDSIHIVMIIANILSAMVYLLTLYMIPEHLNISEVFDWSFFGWVMLILLISWAPLYVSRWIYKKVDPTDSEKLMKNVKRQIINTEY